MKVRESRDKSAADLIIESTSTTPTRGQLTMEKKMSSKGRDKSAADLIIESTSTTPTRGQLTMEKKMSSKEEQKAMTLN
ncbi:hypothetical protein QE152_g23571 [Popillia japonica]|uniref:Uncharacterized protein n=1 Tax=Popillia japonica TaxID=7064 RepID=A0AAW1KF32_POPJA